MKIWGLGTLAFMLFGTVLVFNPLWNPATLGDTPFLNGLLYFYGLPILLCMIAVWRVFNAEPVLQNFYRTFAYGLMFLLVTLEVRHLFHPYQLNRGSIEDMEMYTYSAAWILIAVGTLAAGIVRKSKILRYVSLAVMLLAVIKVFIVDMPALSLIHRFLDRKSVV